MKLGQEKHWYFKPMLPDYWNWDTKPADFKTDSTIPQAGVRRVEELVRAGIPIKQVMYGHYNPKLLPAPKPGILKYLRQLGGRNGRLSGVDPTRTLTVGFSE